MADGPVQTWPDPGKENGPYKILPRTVGDFIVFDTRAKPAQGIAGAGRTIEEAEHAMNALVACGSPMVVIQLPMERITNPLDPMLTKTRKRKPKAQQR